MAAAGGAWSWLTADRRRGWALFGALTAIGVALIVIGEFTGWDWLRLIGIALISLGGFGLGVLAGFSPAGLRGVLGRLRAVRLPLAVVVALVIGLPAVVALLGALDGAAGRALALLGVAIAVLLAAAALFATVMALRALRLAWGGVEQGADSSTEKVGEGP
ncbi:MAG TPA: hypothetical protein VFI42_00950 [Thermomicrobiaceae bacterium]|nr:hypothetical protein [Thermomicrobiaceae bacterium]